MQIHDNDEIEHIDMSDLSDKETSLNESHHIKHLPTESKKEYKKLAYVFVGIFLVSLLLIWARGWSPDRFMGDFMAVFLVTFAAFKFANIDDFSISYRNYDLIAKAIPAWSFIFPFIQGGLGMAYLFLNNPPELNIIMMVVSGTAAIGVIKALRSKEHIMCACLGNIIKLPLSKVSLIEDIGMFVMALAMLFV